MRISDGSSDVCSSDLDLEAEVVGRVLVDEDRSGVEPEEVAALEVDVDDGSRGVAVHAHDVALLALEEEPVGAHSGHRLDLGQGGQVPVGGGTEADEAGGREAASRRDRSYDGARSTERRVGKEGGSK